ncbi:4'-phosphopantetheinyl transferase family protein [Actinoplanes couchii]|uniref:4'-phosphopantetheinyl transferase n=1 Tax=Actinoplanes couchii TaxID=403638 RepID=A0ABQ3X1Z6_9ACTN|nr:4'-phosphopantetheinyl transferase superfamily protein [Actinoplanes couchii]MDR6316877.1 4'-phosphopantetheinyl transferase EntD [Actinoplanes couchii]GID52484.1 4'-phosphopantetheinyl transferase [Actinoplanes couchii]
MTLLEDLLPPGIRCAVAFDDDAPAPLFPAEQELIVGATPARRSEFATVRRCARQALAELGHPPMPIVRGPGGAPVWPEGVAGSLTHCRGFRAAVVAPTSVAASLGIDAEPAGPLPNGVLGLISSGQEREDLARLSVVRAEVPWEKVLFGVKEAFYKAWFPLTGRWLGFRDVVVTLDPEGGFTAVPVAGQPGDPVLPGGRWSVHDGLLLAAIAAQPREEAADALPCR